MCPAQPLLQASIRGRRGGQGRGWMEHPAPLSSPWSSTELIWLLRRLFSTEHRTAARLGQGGSGVKKDN